MIYLQLAFTFIKNYWKAIAVSAVLIGIALFVMSWHNRGLRADAAEAKAQLAMERAQEWHDAAAECSRKTLELMAQNAAFEGRLAEALARPPETIIKYRDRVQVIHDTVLSNDCPTAVAQIASLVTGAGYCEVTP